MKEILSNIELDENKCWNWKGELDRFGHGVVIINQLKWLTHKYVAFLTQEMMTPDYPVSHKCNNKQCCNPEHLVVGFIQNDPNCYLGNIRKIYGPYTRADKRKHVVIVLNDGSKITKSYPKFLVEREYVVDLDAFTETIDHIDRDFTNNEKTNLQILTRAENASKSAVRRKPVICNCPYCNKVFEATVNQLKRSGKCAGPFCSKSCSGKYGQAVQTGKQMLLPKKNLTVEYYRLDD